MLPTHEEFQQHTVVLKMLHSGILRERKEKKTGDLLFVDDKDAVVLRG